MIATVIETIRDLGIPGLVGAATGALIAHFSAKARGREEHARTMDLLVTQDERRAAQGALVALRGIRRKVNSEPTPSYTELYNAWSDNVLTAARLIRSEGLRQRAQAGAYVLFLATLARDEYVTYAVLRAALDVEEYLEAWLRGEQAPFAHLPPMEEISELARSRGGGSLSLEPLNEVLKDLG